MSKPQVTMIVSNLNGMSLNILPDCLESLMNTDHSSWELIVVDNKSNDTSVEYVEKLFRGKSNCRLVKNSKNMYSQGLNLGAKAARGEYLAYFNNDVAVKNGYFRELITAFEKDPRLAIAQGKLLNYFSRNRIDSAGETMDIYGNPVTIGAGDKDRGQFDKVVPILSASGSACMIKKGVFDQLGGYDPDYGIGYEDMDLALRARRLGFEVKRYPKAIVYHKRASTDLAPFIKIRVKWHFNKNRLATMLKNYSLGLLLSALPFTLILYLGITTWEWLVKHNWQIGWVRLTAIGWTVSNLKTIIAKRKRITKQGAKSLGQEEIKLFSPKSLVDLFRDFAVSK